MRKILLFMLALLLFNTSWAQDAPPEMFKFQALITKPDGKPVKNKTVGVKISIRQSATNGTLVYRETFTPTTNNAGIINIEIGNGTPKYGVFSEIPWEAGEFFLKLRVDINGGTNYTNMGTSQLLSVPYALYAKHAQSVEGDNDTDPTNEIELPEIANENDVLTFNGSEWVALENTDADPTNEIELPEEYGTEGQILTSDGEGTVLWQTPLAVSNELPESANENDVLTFNGSEWVALENTDANPTNELQLLNLSGTKLNITEGNSVQLDAVLDSRYVNTSGDTMSGNLILTGDLSLTGQILSFVNGQWVPKPDNVNDDDSNPTNEIQDISINGYDLSITDGSTLTLPIPDGSETKVTGGTNVSVTGSGTTASPFIVNASATLSGATYTIGLWPELGGYVFWISSDGKHGLVAETVDQGTNIRYWDRNIISNPQNYSPNGKEFRDWRLPTKFELNEMYTQKEDIGNFSNSYYWSASEYDYNYVWVQYFVNGSQTYTFWSEYYNMRAVRAF